MGLGIFIGSLSVLIIGLLIAGFGYYAGSTGSDRYNELHCSDNIYNRNSTLNELCNTQGAGIWIGLGSFVIAAIFIIVGFIATIITGVKMAVDLRKPKVTTQ